jgi:hypothetical protein
VTRRFSVAACASNAGRDSGELALGGLDRLAHLRERGLRVLRVALAALARRHRLGQLALQLGVRGAQLAPLLLGRRLLGDDARVSGAQRRRALLELAQLRRRVGRLVLHAVGALELVGALALARLEPQSRLLKLRLEERVLDRAALLVELAILLKLLLLVFELAQALLDVPEHLGDLHALLLGVDHDGERLGATLLVHSGAGHLLEQVETLLVAHQRQRVDTALLHNVVRIGTRQARRLEQRDDILLGDVLLVQKVLVFLETNRAAQHDLLALDRQSIVAIVKHNFDKRRQNVGRTGTLIQQQLSLTVAHVEKLIVAKNEANRF